MTDTPLLRRLPDRRDLIRRAALAQRVQSAFHEMPGLCLTPSQAGRFFGVSDSVCLRLMDELVSDGVIRKWGNHYGALRTHFVGTLFLPAARQLRNQP